MQRPRRARQRQRKKGPEAGVDVPKRAMVLAGGGARGAYEAGVLAYICRELPPNLVKPGSIKVFCFDISFYISNSFHAIFVVYANTNVQIF